MKPHPFKGSGPGFACLHVAGSEPGARQCGKMVDDTIHATLSTQHPLPEFTLPREPEQFWPGSAMAVWQAHTDVVRDLLRKKDAYGDSWVRQGYMGNVGRVLSKADRLRNLLWKDDDGGKVRTAGGDETVLDTLYDLSALCAFAIANIEEGNRWGHG